MRNILFIAMTLALSFLRVQTAFAQERPKNLEKATFAGGCFWCIESVFEKIPGVV